MDAGPVARPRATHGRGSTPGALPQSQRLAHATGAVTYTDATQSVRVRELPRAKTTGSGV